MTLSRIIELCAGVLTALISFFSYCYVFFYLYGISLATVMREDQPIPLKNFLVASLLFVGPSACVFIGSYAHATKKKMWGYLLLLVSGAITNFLILVTVLNGFVFFYLGWFRFLMPVQFLAVLIAVAVGIRVNRDLNAETSEGF